MLTMRPSREKRQGTIELLATAPITDAQVVSQFLARRPHALRSWPPRNVALLWVYAANPPEWKPVLTGLSPCSSAPLHLARLFFRP
jgi:hypothetical protein